jgi:hypothetical protein
MNTESRMICPRLITPVMIIRLASAVMMPTKAR